MDRKISPSFWTDPDIEVLTPEQKLAVLWILTNPQMNLCGFCQVSLKRFHFETGLTEDVLATTIGKLARSFKHFEEKNIIYSRNYIRYQLGSGSKLMKNNIFVSLLSTFRSAAVFPPLAEAILSDYPEINKGLQEGLERASLSLQTPQQGQREGERETKRDVSEKGSGEKPRTDQHNQAQAIPRDEQTALEWAEKVGVPSDFARQIFYKCQGIGWKDGVGRQIMDWPSYIRARFTEDKSKSTEKHVTKANRPSVNGNAGTANARDLKFLYDAKTRARTKPNV
jgi:hypothetical protein